MTKPFRNICLLNKNSVTKLRVLLSLQLWSKMKQWSNTYIVQTIMQHPNQGIWCCGFLWRNTSTGATKWLTKPRSQISNTIREKYIVKYHNKYFIFIWSLSHLPVGCYGPSDALRPYLIFHWEPYILQTRNLRHCFGTKCWVTPSRSHLVIP